MNTKKPPAKCNMRARGSRTPTEEYYFIKITSGSMKSTWSCK